LSKQLFVSSPILFIYFLNPLGYTTLQDIHLCQNKPNGAADDVNIYQLTSGIFMKTHQISILSSEQRIRVVVDSFQRKPTMQRIM
jgi:hypothetical protein